VLSPIPGGRISSGLKPVDIRASTSGAVFSLLESEQLSEFPLSPIREFVVSELVADVVPLLMSLNLSINLVEQTQSHLKLIH